MIQYFLRIQYTTSNFTQKSVIDTVRHSLCIVRAAREMYKQLVRCVDIRMKDGSHYSSCRLKTMINMLEASLTDVGRRGESRVCSDTLQQWRRTKQVFGHMVAVAAITATNV